MCVCVCVCVYHCHIMSTWSTNIDIFFLWRFDPIPGHSLPLRGLAITSIGHNTLDRTSLDNGSARRRDLYLRTHNTHNRQQSLLPAGFEPAIPVTARPLGSAIFTLH